MSTAILAEFNRLSTPEQVQLVEDLWDVIFAKGDGPALTDAQRAMLDRESAKIARTPGDGITLAELKAQILGGRK
jgi:putative addiction module component (TIGR02574 family)